VDEDGKKKTVVLKNALFIPGFQNIFAVKCAVDNGCVVTFTKDSAGLTTENGTTFPFFLHNRLYYLFTCLNDGDCVNRACDLTKWHNIMGHANVRNIKQLQHVVDGMKITSNSMSDCEVCVKAKQCETVAKNQERDVKMFLTLCIQTYQVLLNLLGSEVSNTFACSQMITLGHILSIF
jgi:hypothetical protein